MRDPNDYWLGRKLLRRYKTQRRFGEGGMSRVYEAWDNRLSRRVVVKLVDIREDQADAIPRLHCEALALRFVRHPYVVELLDWDLIRDEAEFIVMEHVDGQPLHKRFRKHAAPRMPVAEVISMVAMLLEGLSAAHQAGVLHRDVKPDNILVTAHGLKLIDFGLAIPLSAGESESTWSRITRPNLCVGTMSFMAPERLQRVGADVDVRGDLYSVGVILYEILTGKRRLAKTQPMEDSSSTGRKIARFEQIFRDPPPFPDYLRRELPPGLEALVLRALHKKSSERFSSAEDMRTALLAIQP